MCIIIYLLRNIAVVYSYYRNRRNSEGPKGRAEGAAVQQNCMRLYCRRCTSSPRCTLYTHNYTAPSLRVHRRVHHYANRFDSYRTHYILISRRTRHSRLLKSHGPVRRETISPRGGRVSPPFRLFASATHCDYFSVSLCLCLGAEYIICASRSLNAIIARRRSPLSRTRPIIVYNVIS